MTGLLASLYSAAASAGKSSGSIGVAAGLPAGQNVVEGTEANLMVGAAAANSNWRKAAVAASAALVTVLILLGGMWFLYKAGGAYADYAVGAIVVGIGVHEVMEGLEDKPKGGAESRPHALAGPLGIDPANPALIEKFQSEHGLKEDGVLGPRTRGAILAELRRRGEEPQPNRLGVDVTDENSVIAFQHRAGLRPDGVIGPRTQGALAAESARLLPDASDPDSIRRFQRRYHLPETGVIDAQAQGALRAVHDGGGGAEDTGDGEAVRSGSADGIDLTNGEGVARFQRERGLPESGVVDAMTQGALRAEIGWRSRQLGLDPADPAVVRRFQSVHGLAQTGVVDGPTQAAIRDMQESAEATVPARWTALGIDPTDQESIKRFQALHGLKPAGEIDADTREQLQRTEEWTAGIDPADPASVARFQAAQGLQPTGVVDAETQGAMRLYRAELQRRHDADPPAETPAWYPLDPTDPGSIKGFQREHGLRDTGTMAEPTQEALRATVADRTREAVQRAERAGNGGGLISKYRDAWPGYFGFILEGGEAGLFTIGVAQGTGQYMVAAIAGGTAFAAPWLGLIWLRDWLQSRPKWVFELTIGTILVTAGTIFGLFRATGVFGGS
jgi:peptidoglycan hydrolase-like protein with peptidoglycan-binding domain